MADTFSIRRLEALLHEQIPLAREMMAEVLSWDDSGLEMAAPLGPNMNHHGTFFGGSASALAILAGWSLVHLLAMEEGMEVAIVVQRVGIRYSAPAPGSLVARAMPPSEAAWRRFTATYRRFRLARLRVSIALSCEGERVAAADASYGVTAHS